MHKHLYRGLTVLSLLVTILPTVAMASHNGSRESTYSRAISRLDDDKVDEFVIPVLFGIRLSNITPDFGDPRGGGTRSHEGQDMVAPLGTPIITPTEAVVTSIGSGDSAGKYVYTANPGGERFRYMHLDDIANIKAGDVLQEGDYIGTVGDTGNAQGGVAHLHFEVREREALDPYPRITKEYTLEEKMELVVRMFKDLDDEDEMAEFLVETYPKEFSEALNKGYDLPTEVKTALRKAGIVDVSSLLEQLEKIIASIPVVVTKDLSLGDSGTEVQLMQVFLIQKNVGPAGATLARSGATGYFGPVTESALREYQAEKDGAPSGIYNSITRTLMRKG